jgi:hypothetical protein
MYCGSETRAYSVIDLWPKELDRPPLY